MKSNAQVSLEKASTRILPNGGKRTAPAPFAFIALAATAVYFLQPVAAQPTTTDTGALYSRIIAQAEQRFGHFYENVDLHIVDPVLYLHRESDVVPPAIDMSGLDDRLRRRIVGQLPFLTTMRITREMTSVLMQGEMATGVYALANGRTLCLISGGNSEMTLASALARYTGLEQPIVPDWVEFDEADLLRFLLHHEVAHCSAGRPSHGHNWTAHDIHMAENLADAFAVLIHLRDTRDETLPHFFALMRESALVNVADREHMTTRSIRASLEWGLASSEEDRLSSMDAPGLLERARELAQSNAFTPSEFAALASDESRSLHESAFASHSALLGAIPSRP